jgi:hypothetical protein
MLIGGLDRIVGTRLPLAAPDWRLHAGALAQVAGQLRYLMISTCGLAALGLLVGCGHLVARRLGDRTPDQANRVGDRTRHVEGRLADRTLDTATGGLDPAAAGRTSANATASDGDGDGDGDGADGAGTARINGIPAQRINGNPAAGVDGDPARRVNGKPAGRRDGAVEAALGATRPVLGVALAATVAVAVTSAVVRTDGQPTSGQLVFLAPFWLLVGAAAVLRRTPQARATARRHLRYALLLAVVAAVVMVALAALPGVPAPEAGLPGRPALAATVVGALLVGLVLLLRSRRGTSVALLGLLLLNLTVLGVVVRRLDGGPAAPTLGALGVRPGDRVWVSTRLPGPVPASLARQVTWAVLGWFDSQLCDPEPAATVAVAPSGRGPVDDWSGTGRGWYRIGGSTAQHWTVWRRVSR